MKKNYSQLICGILLTLGFCSAFNTKAQLIVSCTPTTQCYNGTNQVTLYRYKYGCRHRHLFLVLFELPLRWKCINHQHIVICCVKPPLRW